MKRIPLPSDGENPRDSIASLVDVAFLLLIFFIVTTTILPREGDLPMQVPPDGAPAQDAPSWIEIRADAEGSVWWGEGSGAIRVAEPEDGRDLPFLREMLATAVSGLGPGGVRVNLDVADELRQQRFIDVLNALSAEGVTQIAMRDLH